MSRYGRGDVTLPRTLDQLMFWNYIAHKKERIVLVVCLFLNNTFFKTLKGGNFCSIIFPNFVFHVISHKLHNFLHAVDCFPSTTGQIVNPRSYFCTNQCFNWNPLFKEFRF